MYIQQCRLKFSFSLHEKVIFMHWTISSLMRIATHSAREPTSSAVFALILQIAARNRWAMERGSEGENCQNTGNITENDALGYSHQWRFCWSLPWIFFLFFQFYCGQTQFQYWPCWSPGLQQPPAWLPHCPGGGRMETAISFPLEADKRAEVIQREVMDWGSRRGGGWCWRGTEWMCWTVVMRTRPFIVHVAF